MPSRLLERLTDPRRIARRLRSEWQRVRPFPLPRYTPQTPRTGAGHDLGLYLAPTALTLGAAAMSEEASTAVAALLDRLAPSEEADVEQLLYCLAKAKFGSHWRYADLLTTLWAAATLIRPQSYLEIGVRRGRSAALVGAMCPQSAIYGFDLWLPGYGGAPNPGPDFVRAELRAVGHTGDVVLVTGDSHQTLPRFLRERPDLYLDLITIDGDKSVHGVGSDLASALPRLKVGGIVVFDDLPMYPVLRRVWGKVVGRDGRYATWEFNNAGSGVATAIRVSDQAPLALPC